MADDKDLGPREALSVKRAARLLDIHTNTLLRWGRDGRIQILRLGPRLLRVPRSEIQRLREQSQSINERPAATSSRGEAA